MDKCGVSNAAVVHGDLKGGAPEHGPFNVIFVNGAVGYVPQTWLEQLANGGRLIAALVDGPLCRVVVYVKSGDSISKRIVFDANVPTLSGFLKPQEFIL